MSLYKPLYVPLTCVILAISSCTPSSIAQSSFNPYCQGNSRLKKFQCELAQAQQAKNLLQINKLVKKLDQELGGQAGVPDEPAKLYSVDSSSPKLTINQIRTAFTPYGKRIERDSWWLSRPNPTEVEFPLRHLAAIITGSLAARRAGGEYPDRLLRIAEGAADYLLWAQAQGQQGVFPFPTARGKKGRPFEVAEKFLSRAEQLGKLSDVVVNDWIINDLGGGDLQFDNGVCGVAMLELYQATGENKYLQSAIAAANWAIAQPVVPNWNYNSFSVYLLARAYAVTGDARYLQSAKQKANLGIYPGQLRSGPNQGRWLDSHNARLVYHYIIVRGLGALVAVLPKNDPDLPKAVDTLSKAVLAGNSEIIKKGVVYPETVLEVLSQLQLTFPTSSNRMPDLGRSKAFDLVARYASSNFLAKKLPVGPSAWGLFLEALNKNQ